jgi:REP element-mobilizing transposase RayT
MEGKANQTLTDSGINYESAAKSTVKRRKPRIQEGNIHLCVRGNNRRMVFLEEQDKTKFLALTQAAAEKYDTKIEAFVIMDNHVHLQLTTKQVTNFARWLLRGYSYWYNKKYSLSDKLFRTPFGSFCKPLDEWRLNSILYILANPVSAGICDAPQDYKWSSYQMLFTTNNYLKNFIKLDNKFIYKQFKTKHELSIAIHEFIETRKSERYTIDKEERRELEQRFQTRRRTPTHEIIKYLNTITYNKDIFKYNINELKQLIKKVRTETGATYVQLASIFNESQEFIRRTIQEHQRHR